MAEASTPHTTGPDQSRTQRFARWVTRNRFPVAVFLVLSSLFFLYPIANTWATALGRPLRAAEVRPVRLSNGIRRHPPPGAAADVQEFLDAMGWDPKTAAPTKDTIKKLGLDSIIG